MAQGPAVPTDAARGIRDTSAIHQGQTAHARVAANSGTGIALRKQRSYQSPPLSCVPNSDLLNMWARTPENQVLNRMRGPISDLTRRGPVENSVSVPNAFPIR